MVDRPEPIMLIFCQRCYNLVLREKLCSVYVHVHTYSAQNFTNYVQQNNTVKNDSGRFNVLSVCSTGKLLFSWALNLALYQIVKEL